MRTLIWILFAVVNLVTVIRTHTEARGLRVTRHHVLIAMAILAIIIVVVALVLTASRIDH